MRTRWFFVLGSVAVLAVLASGSVLAVAAAKEPPVKRFGQVIGVRAEKLEEYTKLHAAVWPDVLKMIKDCNIRNYSIYLMKLSEEQYFLFSYFEYTGTDFGADMAKMAADPTTQKWWELCKPCQKPIELRAEGEWWATLPELFHCD